MKELKVAELKQEVKSFRSIIARNIEAKTEGFFELTSAEESHLNCGISAMKKANLEILYTDLIALRNRMDKVTAEKAEAEFKAEEQKAPACPAVENMLAMALGKKPKAKKEPKYGTVEKRTKLVVDKLELAKQNTKENEMRLFFGNGNKKLNGIVTFSLPPVATCPYATENCIMKCYALKDYYRNWDNVSKSQNINLEMTKRADFVEMATKILKIEALKHEVENTVNGTDEPLTVRIHVSGDFYSQEYFDAWVQIAENLKGLPIQFGCYTKSIPFIKTHLKREGKKLSDININFMFSLWDDTKEKFVAMAEEMGMNIFTAYDKKTSDAPADYMVCPDNSKNRVCGSTCNACYEKSPEQKKIAIPIH
ncbi:GP88 family protein [Bacillus mycoides]|uniref:GP88 family protein n=1 Tax=Bacillus mycoides TaxID=1405 RepID=UPI003CFE624A